MTEPPTPRDDPPPVGDTPNDAGPGGAPPSPPPGAVPPPDAVPPPPDAGPPPPGAGPPTGAYPPPGAGPVGPPIGYASSDDKTWVLVAHFGGAAGMLLLGAVGGWIAPLIALTVQGTRSPTVRAHAVAALNFQLVLSIVGLIGWVTACIWVGWLFLVAAWLLGVIVGIIAGVNANDGKFYQYPFSSLQLIK